MVGLDCHFFLVEKLAGELSVAGQSGTLYHCHRFDQPVMTVLAYEQTGTHPFSERLLAVPLSLLRASFVLIDLSV